MLGLSLFAMRPSLQQLVLSVTVCAHRRDSPAFRIPVRFPRHWRGRHGTRTRFHRVVCGTRRGRQGIRRLWNVAIRIPAAAAA